MMIEVLLICIQNSLRAIEGFLPIISDFDTEVDFILVGEDSVFLDGRSTLEVNMDRTTTSKCKALLLILHVIMIT
jgi:hypothetical protein